MNAIREKQQLRAALRDAASRYGQPMIGTVTTEKGAIYDAVLFGAMDIDGHHEREFLLSDRVVYYRGVGLKVKMLDGSSFGSNGDRMDAMAAYAEQFVQRKRGADRDDLRRYERRFATWLRWCAALHPVSVISDEDAADALYREQCDYRSAQALGMPI